MRCARTVAQQCTCRLDAFLITTDKQTRALFASPTRWSRSSPSLHKMTVGNRNTSAAFILGFVTIVTSIIDNTTMSTATETPETVAGPATPLKSSRVKASGCVFFSSCGTALSQQGARTKTDRDLHREACLELECLQLCGRVSTKATSDDKTFVVFKLLPGSCADPCPHSRTRSMSGGITMGILDRNLQSLVDDPAHLVAHLAASARRDRQ